MLQSLPSHNLRKMIMAAATFGAEGIGTMYARELKPKEPRKCSLPSCEVLTLHNGGYCCPEHCKQHRLDMKRKT
jgi:hypothetical protein